MIVEEDSFIVGLEQWAKTYRNIHEWNVQCPKCFKGKLLAHVKHDYTVEKLTCPHCTFEYINIDLTV